MNKKPSLHSDIAFAALLILWIAAILFSGLFPAELPYNIALAGAACAILLLTYFVGLTAGLVANALLVFAAITYVFYAVYFRGAALPAFAWFWPLITPLLTVAVAAFTRANLSLQGEMKTLNRRYEENITVDARCGLKNRRALLQDCETYMRIAARYKHLLTVAVIEVKHAADIGRLLPEAQMDTLVDEVSTVLCSRLRNEDQVYILDRAALRWGVLLLTQQGSPEGVAAERLREHVENIRVSGGPKRSEVLIKMGYGLCKSLPEEGSSPMSLLAEAEKNLVYHT